MIYPTFDGRRYGFIDAQGEVVVSPSFEMITFPGLIDSDNVTPFLPDVSEAMIPVMRNDRWGYINSNGLMTIHPQFDHALFFNDTGIATVCKAGRWGCISHSGDIRINLLYGTAIHFVNGLAIATSDSGYGIINTDGEFVLPPTYESLYYLDHRGRVSFGGKNGFGVMNSKGEILIKPVYQRPIQFFEDLAEITVRGFSGYIDESGAVRIEPAYDIAERFSGGFAAVSRKGTHYYFIDRNGEKAFSHEFDHAKAFHNGLSLVSISGSKKFGMLKSNGEFLLSPSFKVLDPYFFEDVVYGWKGHSCGFWNANEEFVFASDGSPLHFYQGLCAVEFDGGLLGYVDHTGKYIYDPR